MYSSFILLVISVPCFYGEINLEKNSVIWSCNNYPSSNLNEAILYNNVNAKEELSKVDICLQSKPFLLSDGVVQVNIFAKSINAGDVLSIVVYGKNSDGDDTIAAKKEISTQELSFIEGWQTIALDVTGEFGHSYVIVRAHIASQTRLYINKITFTFSDVSSNIVTIYENDNDNNLNIISKEDIDKNIKENVAQELTPGDGTAEQTNNKSEPLIATASGSESTNEIINFNETTDGTDVPTTEAPIRDIGSFWTPLTITVFAGAGTLAAVVTIIEVIKVLVTPKTSDILEASENEDGNLPQFTSLPAYSGPSRNDTVIV